jgi:hypothetical protein
MNAGWDLTHGQPIEIDGMGGFAGGIRTYSEGFSDRRDGERIDEWLQTVNAEGTMDWDRTSRHSGVIHAGHLMDVGGSGRLLEGSGLESADLGCGQSCGAAGSFEE